MKETISIDGGRRFYGPRHDVKVVIDTTWMGTHFHTGPVYYVGHPDECGWGPGRPDACPFEDALDAHSHEHNEFGDFVVRAFTDEFYDDPDDAGDGLEWVRADQLARSGGEV